jgi:hypothetical protein
VLGPSDDGGYYLIGLNAATPELFAGISWSTSTVHEQTRQRAAALSLKVHELRPWFDIDDEAALIRLQDELLCAPTQDRFPAAETRSVLGKLMERVLSTADEKKVL